MSTFFNPAEPGFSADPYDQYARLRDSDPVHESAFGSWVLTRYEDVQRVLRDPSTSVDRSNLPVGSTDRAEFLVEALGEERARRGSRAMLNSDPPDHTRLRRLVSKAFTPRMVEGIRPRAQAVTDDLLDAFDGDGIDVIGGLAFPLPFTVICDLLGMPVGTTRDEVRGWSHTLAGGFEPLLTRDDAFAIADAGEQLRSFLLDVLGTKRLEPGDDLLTTLLHAEDDGDVLSTEELLDQVTLLFVAGHETTVNLIGNGTLALLRHPDQLARLREDPSLAANAVDELLRFDSPVQLSRRIVTSDLTIDGRVIPAWTLIALALASANRDPERFGDRADELDLGRAEAAQHVSFGAGIHHCLGAALARVEGQVAIGTLVRRFPRLALADAEPDWNGRIVLRGLDSLRVDTF